MKKADMILEEANQVEENQVNLNCIILVNSII